MSKEKPTLLLVMNIWNFYTILKRQPAIFFTYIHLFLYSIYSLQVHGVLMEPPTSRF